MTYYNDPEMHRRMVDDDVRTSRFHESIQATVLPGDVVLDVGAGSGVLSLFAARAGAARVYAVEREPGAAELARRLVADNGLAGQVEVVAGAMETVVLPEQVDVVVSEWLGVHGTDENLLAPVAHACNRWLKPGGRVIPATVVTWMAPAWHPAGEEAVTFHGPRYDLNLSALAPYSLDEAVWVPENVAPEQLRAEPSALWSIHPATTPVAAAMRPLVAETSFELTGDGVNGLVTWFTAEMPGTTPLSNAPGEPLTHWGQFLFPLASTADARAGERLRVEFQGIPPRAGPADHVWRVHRDGQPPEVHDSRRSPRPPGEPPWRIYMS